MLRRLLHDFIVLLGAAELVELAFQTFDCILKAVWSVDVLDQSLVDVHDLLAVAHVLCLFPSQLVVQSLHRLLQELHLHFVLVLDFAIFHNNFLVVVLNISLQLVQHTHFQFLVVVNVLSHPVDCIFERSNVAFIFADLRVGRPNGCLHVLLLEAQVFNKESEVGIQRVKLLQLLVLRVRLNLKHSCLHFLWRDLLLKLFDSIVKHEFEFLQLLCLPLELVNFGLSVTNSGVFGCDLAVKQLDVILMSL